MNKDTALILAIIEKMLIHGPQVILEISKMWEVEEPTLEEIKELEITKNARDYFKTT